MPHPYAGFTRQQKIDAYEALRQHKTETGDLVGAEFARMCAESQRLLASIEGASEDAGATA